MACAAEKQAYGAAVDVLAVATGVLFEAFAQPTPVDEVAAYRGLLVAAMMWVEVANKFADCLERSGRTADAGALRWRIGAMEGEIRRLRELAE